MEIAQNKSGTDRKTVIVKPLRHKGKDCLGLYFPYDEPLISKCRESGLLWSRTHRCWHLPEEGGLNKLFRIFKGVAWLDYTEYRTFRRERGPQRPDRGQPISLTDKDEEVVVTFRRALANKRFSGKTVEVYVTFIRHFLSFLKGKPAEEVRREDLELFNEQMILRRGMAVSTQRQMVSALKWFFEGLRLKYPEEIVLVRPRKEKKLPVILSIGEVKKLLEVTRNLKHRFILSLIYAAGLRCGELIDLTLVSIDRSRMTMLVKGKGRKDRQVPLSPGIIGILDEYMRVYDPKVFLVNGEHGGRYTASSMRQIMKRSVRLAGIKKPVTLHTLRHCYATHLMEAGVDLRYVQVLLGHSRPETTQIYTHVTEKSLMKIRSPFDQLGVSSFTGINATPSSLIPGKMEEDS